jgi:hypothetical protein
VLSWSLGGRTSKLDYSRIKKIVSAELKASPLNGWGRYHRIDEVVGLDRCALLVGRVDSGSVSEVLE